MKHTIVHTKDGQQYRTTKEALSGRDADFAADCHVGDHLDRQERAAFVRHLEAVSKSVAAWPGWKRNVLGTIP